jgi:hypothetical protein
MNELLDGDVGCNMDSSIVVWVNSLGHDELRQRVFGEPIGEIDERHVEFRISDSW